MKYLIWLLLLIESVTVTFGGPDDSAKEAGGSASTNSAPSGSASRPVSIDLKTALSHYSTFKNRTALIHPKLGEHKFLLPALPSSDVEKAAAFEKMFGEQSIATIPDGEKFVMIVPFALTNTVTPHSGHMVATNDIIPSMSVNFINIPLSLLLNVYADYFHLNIVNKESAPCCLTVDLVQQTPLSKEEIRYAFDTLLAWRNLEIVADGNNSKLEYIHPPN